VSTIQIRPNKLHVFGSISKPVEQRMDYSQSKQTSGTRPKAYHVKHYDHYDGYTFPFFWHVNLRYISTHAFCIPLFNKAGLIATRF